MKNLNRLLLAFLLCVGLTTYAQDQNNPWSIGIGINAVDYYPVGETAPQGELFDEYFNIGDHLQYFTFSIYIISRLLRW